MRKKLIHRPAREIIASFPGDVVVNLAGLHCASELGIVSPGEPGYQPLGARQAAMTLEELDAMLVRQGRATRAPTAAEREAAQMGSMFGWHVPGADPLNHAAEG